MFLTDELTGCTAAEASFSTDKTTFLNEALDGLLQPVKTLPCKYFYDERGSQLFDRICDLDEYYPTRTELGIMRDNAGEIADVFALGDLLVELGSGSSMKTRLLLDRLSVLESYIPVDISGDYLEVTSASLRKAYPDLNVRPIAADYTKPFAVPMGSGRRVMVYFPGSTIGNFHPDEAVGFLKLIRGLCRETGGLLIGVDLRKELHVLEHAYNDRDGVTAQFNLNLLLRMNSELGANFSLDCFEHNALYNPIAGRIEMHLISRRAQTVAFGGAKVRFEEGETIWTESSYKYSLSGFADLALQAGFAVEKVWTDPQHWFSVQMLRPAG